MSRYGICFSHSSRSAFFPRFALKAPPFGMSSGRFQNEVGKERGTPRFPRFTRLPVAFPYIRKTSVRLSRMSLKKTYVCPVCLKKNVRLSRMSFKKNVRMSRMSYICFSHSKNAARRVPTFENLCTCVQYVLNKNVRLFIRGSRHAVLVRATATRRFVRIGRAGCRRSRCR